MGKLPCRNFIIPFVLIFITLFLSHSAIAEIRLAWDPNVEPDLGGYKVHYGPSHLDYTNHIDIGNVTEYAATNLTPGKRYYFALTAYDISGNESGYSAEVSGIAPKAPEAYVDITSPTGGEVWVVGSTHSISWNTGNLPTADDARIHLFYYYDKAWRSITNLAPDATSFDWTVDETDAVPKTDRPRPQISRVSVMAAYWVNGQWECWDVSKRIIIMNDTWVFNLSEWDRGGAMVSFNQTQLNGYGISRELGMFGISGAYTVSSQGKISGDYTLFDFDDPSTQLGTGTLSGTVALSGWSNMILKIKKPDGKKVVMNGTRFLSEPVLPTNWDITINGRTFDGSFSSATIQHDPAYPDQPNIFALTGSGTTDSGDPITLTASFFLTAANKAYGDYEITDDTDVTIEKGFFSGKIKPNKGTLLLNAVNESGNKYTILGHETTP
jgi:hypothetical protein